MLSFLPVTGCYDRIYSAGRSSTLSEMPSLECVKNVLESSDEIHEVEYRKYNAGQRVTLKGLAPPDIVHSFAYHGSDFWAQLSLNSGGLGEVSYAQQLSGMHTPLPQCVVEAALSVMRNVEELLLANCGLTTKVGEISQHIDDVYDPSTTAYRNKNIQLPTGCGAIKNLRPGFHYEVRNTGEYSIGFVGDSETNVTDAIEKFEKRARELCSGSPNRIEIAAAGFREEIERGGESVFCKYEPFSVSTAPEAIVAELVMLPASMIICGIENKIRTRNVQYPIVEGTAWCENE